MQEESAQKSREISRLEGEVASHLQIIAECKARIREDEMVRRKLHNTIQELKGTAILKGSNYKINVDIAPQIFEIMFKKHFMSFTFLKIWVTWCTTIIWFFFDIHFN